MSAAMFSDKSWQNPSNFTRKMVQNLHHVFKLQNLHTINTFLILELSQSARVVALFLKQASRHPQRLQ